MSTYGKKIVHFREQCIGCNSCTEHARGTWTIDPNDGKANLRDAQEKNGAFVANIAEPEVIDNLYAARDCPMSIIHVLDEQGKEMTL